MEAVGAYVYKDTFVGVAEELCGRTSGKVGIWGLHREAETKDRGRKRWRRQWGGGVEKRETRKMMEGIRDRGEQPPTPGVMHLYGHKKNAVRRAVDRAWRSMEDELY